MFYSRKVKWLLTAFVMIGLGMGMPKPVAAQTGASFDLQRMDAYLNALNQQQRFMGTAAIDSAGSDVYNHSVGFISVEEDTVMANGQTIYRIGSITKTFTAVIIMQLVEEGRVSLSTNLAQFYPDLPQAASVTLEHLLRHQSGIPSGSPSTFPQEWLTEPPTKQQKLEVFRELDPDFEPGSMQRYSNTNYVILEFIIEDVTNESYSNQIEERIVEPLDLQRTYFGDSIDVHQNEAAAFAFDGSNWRKLPAIDPSIPGGAGGIVSTPSDLTDFIYALFEGELVSQESLSTMTTLQDGMGIGMYEIEYPGAFALGHKGGGQGFFSHLAYFPDREVAVAYSANGLNYDRDEIFAGITSIYLGRDVELPDF